MKTYTLYIVRPAQRAAALLAAMLMIPLMAFGSVATSIQPKALPSELVGKYMMNAGELSSMLPITIETVEAQSEVLTLERALLVADAAGSGAIPAKAFLDQNYPNPFNPTTMIRYGLPAQTNVRLTIHSLLGNQMKVAFETIQDPGVYTFDFAAQDLPSGVYFYRLQTDQGTLTRRMTISK